MFSKCCPSRINNIAVWAGMCFLDSVFPILIVFPFRTKRVSMAGSRTATTVFWYFRKDIDKKRGNQYLAYPAV